MISANLKQRIYTSLLLLLLVFLVLNFNIILVYTLILIGVYSALEFLSISKKIFINKFLEIVSNIFFIFYIFLFCFMFYFLSSFALIKLILYSLLFTCIASDIGGFCFGKIFKGPKLTKISPNKTYAGVFGGFLLAVVAGLVYDNFYYPVIPIYLETFINYSIEMKLLIFILIISLISQIGDLIISYFKRLANVKDTGKIIPGHGGILDRIDGLIFAIPISYLILIL